MNMTVSVLASQFKPEWIPNAGGPVVRLSAEEAAKWWDACNELVVFTTVSKQTDAVTLVIDPRTLAPLRCVRCDFRRSDAEGPSPKREEGQPRYEA